MDAPDGDLGDPDASDVRLDLRGLLAAAEAAPPVEAVDVLAVELARTLDATEVSLLIANLSGTAAVRMSHATASENGVTEGANERTEPLTLDDSVHHQVLRSQERHVEPHGDGWRVFVPVSPSAVTQWASSSSRSRRALIGTRSRT